MAARYASDLLSHTEVCAYLASRGLDRAELITGFKLGYCAGELSDSLSEAQRVDLIRLGILNASGGEHFKGCIVFPLLDEAGHVVGFYGRRITANSAPSHLYLPGPHCGLLNRQAATAYREELVLTESIIDALSFVTLGIPNAIACYGVNGFTEEHAKLLHDERAKGVAIGFDSDEAGRAGAEQLAQRLVGEGFAVKVIAPPTGKDWNEALLAGSTKEQVQDLISAAELRQPKLQAAAPFTVTRQGPRYLFEGATLRYRLLGVRSAFVSSLRVNVRAESTGGGSFLDNVDLYSARSRTLFSSAAAAALSLEAPRVEKDLLFIVDHLEAERDRELLQHASFEQHELSDEERKAGMELLQKITAQDEIEPDSRLHTQCGGQLVCIEMLRIGSCKG